MTRLTPKDIGYISERMLMEFERELKLKAGKSLFELFKFLSNESITDLSSIKVFVVPITGGLGIIPGFSEKLL